VNQTNTSLKTGGTAEGLGQTVVWT